MTILELLNQIRQLPIDMLDKDIYIGKAIENYPYGPEYKDTGKAQSVTIFSDGIIIYSI